MAASSLDDLAQARQIEELKAELTKGDSARSERHRDGRQSAVVLARGGAWSRVPKPTHCPHGGDTRAEKLARARELIAAPGQLARELIAAAAQLPPSQQHPPDDRTCEDTT